MNLALWADLPMDIKVQNSLPCEGIEDAFESDINTLIAFLNLIVVDACPSMMVVGLFPFLTDVAIVIDRGTPDGPIAWTCELVNALEGEFLNGTTFLSNG